MTDENKEHEYISEEGEDKAQDKLKKTKKKLKTAQKEAKEYLDGWQRERAEFANYKKDIQKYIEQQRESIKEDTVLGFLGVLDNLELMVQHTPEDVAKSDWYKGVEQIQKQAQNMLKNLGVEEIEAKKGDKFNPELHEAVEGEGDTVEEVIQKGYRINDRVARPVKVKVK